MKRGTIVWVNLSDASPPEMGKVRPAVVVSGTAHNEELTTVVVVPTSSIAPQILPLRLAIGKIAGKDSFAIIPGIRQVRKGRLLGTIGLLPGDQLASLDSCLEAYLR
jgi:mRNA-degrading endonuclease toxin of MazEF toxin-antitoxin module